MSYFRLWGVYTWLGSRAEVSREWSQIFRAFVILQWDNSFGAQVVLEGHLAAQWPSGELATPQGETHTYKTAI